MPGLNSQPGLKVSGGKVGRLHRLGRYGIKPRPEFMLDSLCELAWRNNADAGCRGISWAFSGALNTLTNGYTTPNSRIPDIVTHWTGYFAPRSYHSGGAEVVMADGSVHFLTNGVNAPCIRILHSANGGEVASVEL